MSKAILRLRERLRSREPKFLRQESWRYKRLETGWRKPKGKTSKMRRRLRGWPKLVKVGYKLPKEARGLHPSGSVEVLVRRPEDLQGLDPAKHVVRIAHTVGERKRVAIIQRSAELGLRVLNLRRAEIPEVGVGGE
ncbi:MAG: 50S ribosomal protein L32e [Candidatus Bathyarchaeia archaeon]